MTELQSARAMRLNPVVRPESEDLAVNNPVYVPSWILYDAQVVTKQYWEYDKETQQFVPTAVVTYPDDTVGVRLCNGDQF